MVRSERQAFGPKYKIDIFADVGSLYISRNCKCPNLAELIKLSGGRTVNCRQEAKYIISDKYKNPMQNYSDGKAQINGTAIPLLHSSWILDCISKVKIINIHKYILKEDSEFTRS